MQCTLCALNSLILLQCDVRGDGGVKVSMVAFQAIDPGSIPGHRIFIHPQDSTILISGFFVVQWHDPLVTRMLPLLTPYHVTQPRRFRTPMRSNHSLAFVVFLYISIPLGPSNQQQNLSYRSMGVHFHCGGHLRNCCHVVPRTIEIDLCSCVPSDTKRIVAHVFHVVLQ